MTTQDNHNNPVHSHLDPERDSKTYPDKWDLSSLPLPAHPPLNSEVPGQDGNEPAQPPSTKMSKRYAEMQIDPFLDGDAPESCWGRQI